MTWKEKLKALRPCPEAYKWACQYSTLRQAWRACERGDWMGWLMGVCEVDEYTIEATWVAFEWCGQDPYYVGPKYIGQHRLVRAYIILDFMPDPPELP